MASVVFVSPQTKFSFSNKSFEKPCKYAKDVFSCFVDPEKAYDRVPRNKFWRMLQLYNIDGHLLMAIKSL